MWEPTPRLVNALILILQHLNEENKEKNGQYWHIIGQITAGQDRNALPGAVQDGVSELTNRMRIQLQRLVIIVFVLEGSSKLSYYDCFCSPHFSLYYYKLME